MILEITILVGCTVYKVGPYTRWPILLVAAKKPIKKPVKLTLVILTLLVAPLAGSTRSISNTSACLDTASVTPKASTVNKRRKPSTPPLRPPKPSSALN